jgi:hypothetical protein
MKSGCTVVNQVGERDVERNLIPHLWYKNITFLSWKTGVTGTGTVAHSVIGLSCFCARVSVPFGS